MSVTGKLIACAAATFAVIAVAAPAPGRAGGEGGASPDYSIGIDRSGDGVPECSTHVSPPVDSCRVGLGELFTAQVTLHSIAGLPDLDGDTVAGYTILDMRVRWSVPGMELENRPGSGEVVAPFCGIRPKSKDGIDGAGPDDNLRVACIDVFGSEEETFLGTAFEFDLRCPNLGTSSVVLPHDYGDAHVHDEISTTVLDLNDGGVPEVLTIDCAFIWDVDQNGVVTAGDIGHVVGAFGEESPFGGREVDMNGDGVVTATDIARAVSHYGEAAPP
jgi:hypothetical protein